MPVDRTLGADLASTVTALYAEAELVLTKQIANRVGSDLGSPDWAQKRLAQVGEMRRIAERVTQRLAADSTGLVADAVAQAYQRGGENALTEMAKLGGARPGAAAAIRSEATGSAAVQRLANALVTRLGGTHLKVVRETADIYRKVISTTVATGTLQGAETRRESAQRAMKKFAATGITGFTDVSGRNWQLTSYVEMATRTGTAQAAVEGHLDRLEDLDIDLVIVSNAPQECDKCRPWEGKVLARRGPHGRRTIKVEHSINDDEMIDVEIAGTVDEAVGDGFMHPNCRHSLSAYLPGVTKPITNTDDPEGDKARQEQRAIERDIRKARLEKASSLSPTDQRLAQEKIDAATADLKTHLANNPALKRLRYREQIGAGNLPTKSASDAGVPTKAEAAPRPKPSASAPASPVTPKPTSAASVPKPAPPKSVQPAPIPDRPATRTPAQLANSLAAGETKPIDLSIDELRQADQVFTDRAAKLGKPDQVGRTHMAIRKELARRTPDAAPVAPKTLGMQAGRRFDTDKEAVEWATTEMPLPKLSQEQAQAVEDYSMASYVLVNDGLRGLEDMAPKRRERFDHLVSNIDAAIEQSLTPEPIVVHRGVNTAYLNVLGANAGDAASVQALVGKVFKEPGYVSTSIGTKAAFAGKSYIMFRVPQGYRALNVMPLAGHDVGEREILIHRDAQYVIHAAYQKENDPTWYIEAEFVPDGWAADADWVPDPYGDAWKGYQ